jgi:hypothetical protein
MSTPILDPSLPADHSPLSSGEMRGQFQAIQNRFDAVTAADQQIDALVYDLYGLTDDEIKLVEGGQ